MSAIPLLLFPIAAAAAATPEPEAMAIVQEALKAATDGIFIDLQTWAVRILSMFMLVQFTLTNVNLLLRGDELSQVWAKFLGSLLWFGICFYLMEAGAPFMQSVAGFFYGKAGAIAGGSFTPGYALNFGLALTNNLLVALDNSQSILDSLNPFPSIMLGIVSVAILVVSALIAFKIFMLIAETSIVIAVSPLSFALLGLNALKDQGLAPLKYLIAMAYRAIILGAVIACMSKLGVHINKVFDSLPSLTSTGVWTPIWASVLGYSLLGLFAVKADSIAAMLASGSSQMSTGDAAAVGAAAAAVGGAAAQGVLGSPNAAREVAGVVGAAGGAARSAVSESMKNLPGRGGDSMSNALGKSVGDAPNNPPQPLASKMINGGGNPRDFPKAGAEMALKNTNAPASAVNAAGKTAKEGQGSKAIADSAIAQGASQGQGAAAAVGAKLFDYGATQPQFDAGVKAAAAGKSPGDVARAVSDAGGSQSLAAAAENAARDAQAVGGDGKGAGIGGAKDNAATPMQPTGGGQRGFLDRLGEVNQHIAQENAVVSVSLNTNAE